MSANSAIKRNVTILSLCQALYASGISLTVATTALVGFELADNKAYASLPFSVQLLATMFASIPAALLMERLGRKPAYLLATVVAMIGSVLCTIGILQQQFWIFTLGSVAIGIFSGFANFYRFTAADSVTPDYKSRAISYVLLGGVIAAFIGPNLANLTRNALGDVAFAGSYAATVVLYILSFILLAQLQLPHSAARATVDPAHPPRPLTLIARQPRFIIAVICAMLGYAVMSLVMTATPLAMHHHAHPFAATSFVIQWHVVAMFAPAFFTGHLINRLGLPMILGAGVLIGVACVVVNLSGTGVWHFWLGLVLLGLSWNFLFIGGTTLLTETYLPSEKFKTQALNDFLVFSMVALASLSAGILQHHYSWEVVNYSALPALLLILLGVLWLHNLNKHQPLQQQPATPRS